MSILKIPAAMAALLFMAVSAQAMDFANRPGLISETLTSASTIHALQGEERLRRQIKDQNILQPVSVAWMKLADRPRPLLNLKRIWVRQTTVPTRPGRLSAEFSAIARGYSMNFEYGPGELSSWLKPTAIRMAMKFAHHPGPIESLFPPFAAANIKFADRGFTSLTKINIPSEIEAGRGSAGFCVGSMAPCGSLNFANLGSLSPTYTD